MLTDARSRPATLSVRQEDGTIVPAVIYDDGHPALVVVAILDRDGRETGVTFRAARRAVANCQQCQHPLWA